MTREAPQVRTILDLPLRTAAVEDVDVTDASPPKLNGQAAHS